jgi:hypothetical protein
VDRSDFCDEIDNERRSAFQELAKKGDTNVGIGRTSALSYGVGGYLLFGS